jgi:hypothetical protein
MKILKNTTKIMTLTIKSTVCFILILLSSMKIKVVFIGFFQIFLQNCKFEFWTVVSLISFTCSMSSTCSMSHISSMCSTNPRLAMFSYY